MLEDVRQGSPVRVVTGAAGGIGGAVAVALAEEGVSLVLVDSRPVPDTVTDVASKLGAESHAVEVDLSDPAAVDELIAALWTLGRCDVLVNCAGVHIRQENGARWPASHIDRAMWEYMSAVNLTSPMVLCQAVAPLMVQAGRGRIVNISSLAARVYVDRVSAYYATTKSALTTFTRYLADECAGGDVTVNSVAPGTIDTGLFGAGSVTSDRTRAWFDSIPARRMGMPEDVAGLVKFLISENASYITGAVIDVNGGAF